ncbi:hypothetical protein AMTRI_Chr03g143780 [Amborella trichopoda]
MTNFNNFIISNGLLDLNIVRTTFAWSNNSALHPQMSRIDKVLIHNQWDSIFPKALPHTTLDHVPCFWTLKDWPYPFLL